MLIRLGYDIQFNLSSDVSFVTMLNVHPSNNTPRIGRILMATGRDAADVAITTTFGSACLTKFSVVTDEVGVNETGLNSLDPALASPYADNLFLVGT
jgi:hypothetical protein